MPVRFRPGRGPAWPDLKTWAAGLASCLFCESVVVLAATLFLGLAVELTAVGPLGEGLSKAALAMLAAGAAGFMLVVGYEESGE